MAYFVKPKHKKGDIDRAGATLIDQSLNFDQDGAKKLMDALEIIDNWRAAHRYPMQALNITLRDRAKRVDPSVIVAQRLKRLPSIMVKLQRNKNMALSQMQDIGGCRAVLKDVDAVDRLVVVYEQAYAKNPNARSQLVKKSDYIAAPKTDGYRSVHLIYKYRSGSKAYEPWNGLRVELQLRSRLQHAWATAVETVDAFTAQTIKIGGGGDDWRRFFLLMGAAIALRERRPICPNCPGDRKAMRKELGELVSRLNVKWILNSWAESIRYLPTRTAKDVGVYLLYLDTNTREIRVTGFPGSEQARASDEYLEIEKKIKDNPTAQAVLVEVESIKSLRSAYPNYYADTRVFIRAMEREILGLASSVGKDAPVPVSPGAAPQGVVS